MSHIHMMDGEKLLQLAKVEERQCRRSPQEARALGVPYCDDRDFEGSAMMFIGEKVMLELNPERIVERRDPAAAISTGDAEQDNPTPYERECYQLGVRVVKAKVLELVEAGLVRQVAENGAWMLAILLILEVIPAEPVTR
jgi:hypothetical protein